MKNKSLFFDFKRTPIINILIIIQIMFWVFYMASFISILNFKTTFIKRFDEYYPRQNGARITFEKMMINDSSEIEKIGEVYKCLDKNDIPYEIVRDNYQSTDVIEMNVFSQDLGIFYGKYRDDEFPNKIIEPNSANYTFIKNKSKFIEGEIEESEWKVLDNKIPIILGSNLRKLYNIGDRISYSGDNKTYKGKEFEIKGFFKAGVAFSTGTNSTNSSQIANGKVFIPLSKEDEISKFSFDPIVINLSENNLPKDISHIREQLNEISTNITIDNFDVDLNRFFDQIETSRLFEQIRLGIISFIIGSSIIISIGYRINISRERIGILYAFGGSKGYILKKVLEEFMVILFIGCLLGQVFYLKEGKSVYSFFLNENIGFNLVVATVLLILIILILVGISLRKINKLSPRELIGGLVE